MVGQLEVFEPADHVFGAVDAVDKFEKAHPIADAVLMLLTEDNAGVGFPCPRQLKVIGIVRAEHAAEAVGQSRVVDVALTQ